jgi:hypothetical protein
MRLLFDPTDGKIYHAVLDRDRFAFEHATIIPLAEFVIDETTGNRAVCLDLWQTQYQTDAEGRGKYYLVLDQASGEWELHEREGWQPFEPKPEVTGESLP